LLPDHASHAVGTDQQVSIYDLAASESRSNSMRILAEPDALPVYVLPGGINLAHQQLEKIRPVQHNNCGAKSLNQLFV